MNPENDSTQAGAQKSALEQIKTGHVTMRPRSFFVMRAALALVGLVALVLVAIFLVSFVLFYLDRTGASHLPAFGLPGLRDLLLSLPALIVGFLLLAIALVLWLSERYAFTYRNPLLYSLVGVIVLVVLGGYAVARTPLHPYFFRTFAGPEGQGLFHALYERPRVARLHNGIVGLVQNVETSRLTVESPRRETWYVILSADTDYDGETTAFSTGDWVVVRGPIENNTIRAIGIRKIPAIPDMPMSDVMIFRMK